RAGDTPARQRALRDLHTSATRAARLVHQLLALARAEPAARLQPRFQTLDLVAVARAAGEEWIHRAMERKIDFGFVGLDERVSVEGNKELLTELLGNLIDNALRYSGPNSRVTLEVLKDPTPSLNVEDDGPGIPLEEREKVFERFYRLAESRAD